MNKRRFHMIGNTHIDPVWLWKRAEGMQEIKSSFASALDRMTEFPDFKFTMSSISYLEWVKHNCPELFQRIKERVMEGRWEIAGAMWVEPDCILPSAESLIRHFLYGKQFIEENFGIETVTGYNVDSFGHGSNLPAILAGCGMKYYIFNRPDKKNLEIPPVFRWSASGGSKVTAERIGGEYLAWTKPGIEFNLKESMGALEYYGYDRMAVFYGVGNHGGGPTIDNIRSVYELKEEYGEDELKFSTTQEFFEDVEDQQLQEFTGELGRIFTGCYSSDSEIKRLNRNAEWSLLKAEAIGAIASELNQTYQYPKEEMERAWKMLLFNQFHDILSGTSIEPARKEACQEFNYALTIARHTIDDAVQGIANSIDTRGDGFPLILINPTGSAFHGIFQAAVYVSAAKRKQVRIRNTKGDEIPYAESNYQSHDRDDARKNILFMADIPAMGYAVYRVLQEGPDFKPVENCMTVTDTTISNGVISLTIDEKTGCPSSLIKGGVNLLSAPAAFKIFYDDRGAWGAEPLEEKLLGMFEAKNVKVIENNFLRIIIRSVLQYNKSELLVDYVLERDSEIVKMNCRMHNHEGHTQICFCLPVSGKNHMVITETALLAEQKVNNDGSEYYQHRFADIRNEKGQGIAVINNCSYGMCQKAEEYRLILTRNVLYARGDSGPVDLSPQNRFMDQGCFDFSLELLPHDVPEENQRLFTEADLLHMPMEYLGDSNHTGVHWLRQGNAIEVTGDGVQVSCYKPALDGKNGKILRIFECEGRDTQAIISKENKEYHIALSPYDVKTLRFEETGMEECDMLERDKRE
jgi:alpha-mannosidase